MVSHSNLPRKGSDLFSVSHKPSDTPDFGVWAGGDLRFHLVCQCGLVCLTSVFPGFPCLFFFFYLFKILSLSLLLVFGVHDQAIKKFSTLCI